MRVIFPRKKWGGRKPSRIGCVETGMKDEVNILRARMAQMAAAGNNEAVAAIQEAIADMEEEETHGDEEE